MEIIRSLCECLGLPKQLIARLFNRKYPKMKDAVADGNIAKVEEYYLQNYPISGEDENILHIAIQNKQQEMVDYILNEMDASIIQEKNSDGDTPLMLATMANNQEMVKKLVDRDAFLNVRQNEGATPFIAAAANGYLNILKFLYYRRANPHIRNFRGETALHRACFYGQMEVIIYLIDNQLGPGMKLCKRDRAGNNCLHAAAEGLSINCLRYFMMLLSDDNLFQQTNQKGETVFDILKRQVNSIKEEGLKDIDESQIIQSLSDRLTALHVTTRKCFSKVFQNRKIVISDDKQVVH